VYTNSNAETRVAADAFSNANLEGHVRHATARKERYSVWDRVFGERQSTVRRYHTIRISRPVVGEDDAREAAICTEVQCGT